MKHLSFYLGNKFLWIFLIIAFIVYQLGTHYLSESVETFTNARISNYASEIIASGIEEEVIEKIGVEDYFVEHYDSTGKVSYAFLNTTKINELRNNTSRYLVECIKKINDHESFDEIEIPLGYFIGTTSFLANGVRVPLNIEVVGSEDVAVDANVTKNGINTTIIELYLKISLNISIAIPFQSRVVETTTTIPLSLHIMNNEIPYYLGSLLKE